MKFLRLYLAVTAIPFALTVVGLLYIDWHPYLLSGWHYFKEPSSWTPAGVGIAVFVALMAIVPPVVGLKMIHAQVDKSYRSK